jgi:hypothetical protein
VSDMTFPALWAYSEQLIVQLQIVSFCRKCINVQKSFRTIHTQTLNENWSSADE